MSTSGVNNDSGLAALAAQTASQSTKKEDASERFLKLLVTQMQNQDPLNPMDNAQVTSQMAQISTVTGIDKLNDSVTALGAQMVSQQALQGAALIGRTVLLEGNKLHLNDERVAAAGFELSSAADSVKIEVLSPAGRVIDTIDLGAQPAGRGGFEWKPAANVSTDGATFRVVAKSGATTLSATPLTADLVNAVSTGGDGLTLELLFGGPVAYNKIKAFS
ncbi:flagellar hook assembly protein FlgD [Caldimonas sp. KR1-144]|uniref:flagellar hook assembly protein FlgD n=1 Tax=Caldimonas sp. KR1-144 TaxID=3400911 RepID=UPI003C0581DA